MKWFIGLLIFVSALYADTTVIASDGDVVTAKVSSKASRCDYYIFVDKNGKVINVIENAHKDVRGGASSALVSMLNDKKVSHIIAASFGDKLVTSLRSNNMTYTVYTGSVESAITEIIKK